MENKKKNLLPLALFFVNLLKMLSLANAAQLGIDFYKGRTSFSYHSLIFWACALCMSALIAVFYARVSEKNADTSNLLFALMVLDPSALLVVRMSQCLLLYVLVYLILINESREKPLVNRELLLILFSFAASLVFAHSVFSFVPFAIVAYLIARKAENDGKNRTIAAVVATLVLVILGIVLHKQLRLAELNVHINGLPVSDKNSFILMGLSVPYAVFVCCYIYINSTVRVQKTEKRNKKKKQSADVASFVSVNPIVFALLYAISLIGGFMGYPEALYMVNAAAPLLILLSLGKDEKARKTMHIMTDFVKEHIFVFAVAAVCICYIAIRIILYFGIADNTIVYLITEN